MRTSLQVTVIVLSTAFLSCRFFSITSKITGCAVLRLKWNVRLTGSRPRLNYTVVAVSSLRWDRGKGDGNVVQFSRSSVLRWSIVGETPTTFSKPRIRMLTAVDRQDRSVGMEDKSRLGLAGNAEDGGEGAYPADHAVDERTSRLGGWLGSAHSSLIDVVAWRKCRPTDDIDVKCPPQWPADRPMTAIGMESPKHPMTRTSNRRMSLCVEGEQFE